jgi:hypothetical protein
MAEYDGYGLLSHRTPTSKAIDRNSLAGYLFLVHTLGIPPECVIIWGMSIGTGPAARLAKYAKSVLGHKIGGLVLQAPYKSIEVASQQILYIVIYAL